jgi:hypothetical protein
MLVKVAAACSATVVRPALKQADTSSGGAGSSGARERVPNAIVILLVGTAVIDDNVRQCREALRLQRLEAVFELVC